jgi:hypothetical protein
MDRPILRTGWRAVLRPWVLVVVLVVAAGAGAFVWWRHEHAGPSVVVDGLRFADVTRIRPDLPTTVLTAAAALPVAQAINVLPLPSMFPRGVTNCPADTGRTDTVVFHADETTTAVIKEDGCATVTVTRGGRTWRFDESTGTVRAALSTALGHR